MSKKLAIHEIEKLLAGLTEPSAVAPSPYLWRQIKDVDRNEALARRFKFKSFEDTWAFLTKVSLRSHLLGHHPKITTVYNVVDMELTTHDVSGLTTLDFKMASRFSRYAKDLGEKYD
ncbi:DEKNAAC104598 [Brettanomyces naardenensis]|uniref:4a-hydroxytetrahydrobiopterin dehydratase n=1 Tax=Brettanomyces naardenensis TaxID=13370 RepID=A0A448YR91_BRENA|nr:DEKNAAC104598 [Brettanomyces naardenensis]